MQNLAFLPTQEFTIAQANLASGLYRIPTSLPLSELISELDRSGFRVFLLEGKDIETRSSYLQAVANLFEFGSQFGQNWDALADSLRDLTWGQDDRIVVIYSDCEMLAMAHPEAWEIMMEIWQVSVEFWQGQGVRLSIVFQVGKEEH